MPIDYRNYPKNWKSIRAEILTRSGNRCECQGECGKYHDPNGKALPSGVKGFYMSDSTRCHEVGGNKPVYFNGQRVILTIAHLNHRPKDSRRCNLKAMCQACHLRYDAPAKSAKRKKSPKWKDFDA